MQLGESNDPSDNESAQRNHAQPFQHWAAEEPNRLLMRIVQSP